MKPSPILAKGFFMLEDLVTLAVDEFSVWKVVLADAAKLINDEVLVICDNCGKSI